MKKTWLHRAVSVLMSGVLLSGMLGTPAAAAQRQVDAYGRDFTRVEGGTYFSERTGESTYRERIHTYICPENNGGKHILEYHKEAPTCTEKDYNAYYCVLCGERELNVEFPALGHAYTDTVTVPATEEATGVRTYTCAACGETYTEEIPPLGGGAGSGTQEGSCKQHTWQYRSVPATCTEDGKYERTCLQCGAREVTKVLPALGHNDVVQKVIRPATVEQEGEQLCRCSRCGDVHTVAIPRLEESPAAAATGLRDSGSTELEKLSQAEIEELLEQAPLRYEGDVFVQMPSVRAPFSSGTVEKDALQAAADRLNALRRIAGLPAVKLDMELSRSAQYGAVIQAAQGGD